MKSWRLERSSTIICISSNSVAGRKADLVYTLQIIRFCAKELNVDQRIQYFISNTYFSHGHSHVCIPDVSYSVSPFGIKPLNTEDGLVWHCIIFRIWRSTTQLHGFCLGGSASRRSRQHSLVSIRIFSLCSQCLLETEQNGSPRRRRGT